MSTDTVLLIDADNAFNSLNHAVALHNIQYPCPPLATILTNIYRTLSRLFMTGPDGTYLRRRYHPKMPPVHGDVRTEHHPFNRCQNVLPTTMQVWYADDAASGVN